MAVIIIDSFKHVAQPIWEADFSVGDQQGFGGNGTLLDHSDADEDGAGVPPSDAIKRTTTNDRHRYGLPVAYFPENTDSLIEFDLYIPAGQGIIGKTVLGTTPYPNTIWSAFNPEAGYPSTFQEGLNTYKGTFRFFSVYRFLGCNNGQANIGDVSYMTRFVLWSQSSF